MIILIDLLPPVDLKFATQLKRRCWCSQFGYRESPGKQHRSARRLKLHHKAHTTREHLWKPFQKSCLPSNTRKLRICQQSTWAVVSNHTVQLLAQGAPDKQGARITDTYSYWAIKEEDFLSFNHYLSILSICPCQRRGQRLRIQLIWISWFLLPWPQICETTRSQHLRVKMLSMDFILNIFDHIQ
jgi:hypothetical protein